MRRYARLNKIYGRFVQFGGTPEGVRRIVFSCKGRTGGVRPERLRDGLPRRTAARRSCRREAGLEGAAAPVTRAPQRTRAKPHDPVRLSPLAPTRGQAPGGRFSARRSAPRCARRPEEGGQRAAPCAARCGAAQRTTPRRKGAGDRFPAPPSTAPGGWGAPPGGGCPAAIWRRLATTNSGVPGTRAPGGAGAARHADGAPLPTPAAPVGGCRPRPTGGGETRRAPAASSGNGHGAASASRHPAARPPPRRGRPAARTPVGAGFSCRRIPLKFRAQAAPSAAHGTTATEGGRPASRRRAPHDGAARYGSGSIPETCNFNCKRHEKATIR